MVEQYWRDNRLNMIHEGTHGIQALDLLGRKVVMDGGAGLVLLAARIGETIQRAGQVEGLAVPASELAAALQRLGAATKAAWATGVPEEALANATPYLQAFGHVVLAWLWLDVALAVPRPGSTVGVFGRGKLSAMRYFFAYELPRIDAWLGVVSRREALVHEMPDDAF
jgi:butyryl-CoA dehydrogenase